MAKTKTDNSQNLIQHQPPETQAAVRKAAGVTRARNARRRKRFKNALGDALKIGTDVTLFENINPTLFNYLSTIMPDDPNITEDNKINVGYALGVSMVVKALQGDPKAFEVIRDTMGEKPVDKIETDSNINGGFRVVIEDVMPEHD